MIALNGEKADDAPPGEHGHQQPPMDACQIWQVGIFRLMKIELERLTSLEARRERRAIALAHAAPLHVAPPLALLLRGETQSRQWMQDFCFGVFLGKVDHRGAQDAAGEFRQPHGHALLGERRVSFGGRLHQDFRHLEQRVQALSGLALQLAAFGDIIKDGNGPDNLALRAAQRPSAHTHVQDAPISRLHLDLCRLHARQNLAAQQTRLRPLVGWQGLALLVTRGIQGDAVFEGKVGVV